MRMNLRLYIICIAAVLALVIPAVADNSTATVHGGVYGWDTFEPLENAVVDVNSTPSQSMVAKSGMYSFELEPGNYSITARYYQNNTLAYSTTETIIVKKGGGSYVLDLLLLPIYSEELMDGSDVNGSSKNSTSSTGDQIAGAPVDKTKASDSVNITEQTGFYSSSVNYFLIAIMFILLLTAGYRVSIKYNNIEKNALQGDKTGQIAGDSPGFRNIPERPVKAQDESIDPEVKQDFQVNAEDTTFETEQLIELESKVTEKKEPAENKEEYKEEYPEPEAEITELGSEEENKNNSSEEPADNSEIEISAPKKKLPLPADLQEVMDIIRGHGGRITQKDLRSRLKYSEGKVSLMLADLERRDLIEKFKRGRGNVVLLKDEER